MGPVASVTAAGAAFLLVLQCLLLFLPAEVAAQTTPLFPDLCGYTWDAIDQDKGIHYKLNLCDKVPSTECGGLDNSAICAHNVTSDSYMSVGDSSLKSSSDKLFLFNTTKSCTEADTPHKVQSSIEFLCAKSLGTPEFVTASECVHYFEWRTSAACKKDMYKAIKEVPCYVFDHDWKKHDLNPLIKWSGSYLVDDSDDDDLFINICRNIGGKESDTSSCPQGSAACVVRQGQGFDVGQPKEGLKVTSKDRLHLHYEKKYDDKERPPFCSGYDPTVSITFVCPSKRTERTDPKLTAKTNCRYEIEWVTEYACHRDYLESETCILTSAQHDVSIDLNPLSRVLGTNPYSATDDKKEYNYYLNVCRDLQVPGCEGEKVSSCQVKRADDKAKVAGRSKNQILRYSDGDLTLAFPGGDVCSSGFQRMTVINFECNETAEGAPVFQREVDCTYFFSWDTKYACVKEKEDLLCRVIDKKKRYDLSPLSRLAESDDQSVYNWEAVRSDAGEMKTSFFINICHKVLQKGAALGCPEEAAVCSVGGNTKKNLGKFLSPPKKVGENIQLLYSDGDFCSSVKKIQTVVTLVCRQGDLESAPVLKHMDSDGCGYEFEWHTAAACVLSKTEGDHCRVSDMQAGFSFDLSPLTIKNGSYHVNTSEYDFYLNVCGGVSEKLCEENSGACQVSKKQNHWNLGVSSSRLTYYDGLIQLNYRNGTAYNDGQHTQRSSLITFLCDRNAGIGQPEYQMEDKYAYNFKWHTKYACSQSPLECVVTDPSTNEQYDLSRLSVWEDNGAENWYAMDTSTRQWKKYYINVCRPLNPVTGCDRYASVCQIKYERKDDVVGEVVSIRNLGVASKGPVFEEKGRLLLEYTNGSECINADGEKVLYTTKINLICSEGSLSSSPRFIQNQDCVVIFIWNTEAACPVTTTSGKSQACTVQDPNTGFAFNFQPLSTDSGYTINGNGKTFKLNICGTVKDCRTVDGKPAAGCEFEEKTSSRPVGAEGTLLLSTEGFSTLTYYGTREPTSGTQDEFIVQFVCNDDLYPGNLTFIREEINTATKVHDTFFQFQTALACMPAPVDCQVTDSAGNEYDLSDLSKEREPWIAVDTSANGKNRTFYLNVCKPLPYLHGCHGGAIGSCVKYKNETSYNLGIIQISPQAATDGSLSIVYLSGDYCKDEQRYSTRIIFHCDRTSGSPLFQQQDGCEFVFVWRTQEACPVLRAEGTSCQVRDPKYGYSYNLTPLGGKEITVAAGKYEYHFTVCGVVSDSSCLTEKSRGLNISSCQVQIADHKVAKIAGLYTTNITYDNGLIMINYTGGEACHKIYKRSTAILFYCDPNAKMEDILYSGIQDPVNKAKMQPVFQHETADCTYLFEWRTPYACPPFKSVQCSFRDSDNNWLDLSSLSQYKENWEVITRSGSTGKYYLNVCSSLVPETGLNSCPNGAAACLVDGSKSTSLGEPSSGPQWENGVSVLKYTNGDFCPNGIHKRTTMIRFKCDENRINSKPELVSVLEDCEYTFVWFSAAACPLKSSVEEDCRVTSSVTGHLFDLTSLSKDVGYTVEDRKNRRSILLNICAEVKSSCEAGTGVCVMDGQKHINAGKFEKQIIYTDQVLKLLYKDGDLCPADNSLKYRSIFIFVCNPDVGEGSKPVLTSFDEKTCIFYFSWHTSLVCERQVKCFVQNGSSVIDLSPLIQRTGYYEADDDDVDDTDFLDFYINICQPLNSIPDVTCPPEAAVCMVPVEGLPVDIGRVAQPPQINPSIQEVYINFDSTTPCPTDRSVNYSSLIVFHCKKGTDLGTPKMLRKSECSFVFEWNTPVVCPDEVTTSGCSLTDEQLHYTFNLSSLSGNTYKTSGSSAYHVGVCAPAADVPQGKCKDGAVCLVSDSSAFSFGNFKAMKMDYQHQDETLILQYGGGDPCPQATGKRQSTIFFKCDEKAENENPVLLSETLDCAVTFEWKTQAVCLPKKMTCRFTQNHKMYDLRPLSSLTKFWIFDHAGSVYYLNLCQGVFEGPTGCPKSASMCRKDKNGNVQVLGQVYTQKMKVTGDTVVVNYSNGFLCGKGKKASTIIELKCAKTFGKPVLQSIDEENCEYHILWETRAACVVKPQSVEMVNGTIFNTESGKNFTLGEIYFKRYNASGDRRANGDNYIYEIQLSGTSNSAVKDCQGVNICQIKTNAVFYRPVGFSSSVQYFIQDDDLDVIFSSPSKCGKDESKSSVSSTIVFHCDATAGEGIPKFLHETADCQYLFSWYTSAVCPLVNDGTNEINESGSNMDQHTGFSVRSQAVGALLGILLVILTACLLILFLYKKERRETMIQQINSCCRRSSNVSYKYTKVNSEADENETEWLMEEISSSNQRPRKESQENGHITANAVRSAAFTSLPVDDQDSEDEVLIIPEVKICSERGNKPQGPNRGGNQSSKSIGTSDESTRGLCNGGEKTGRAGEKKKHNSVNLESFHDDSDEDMLNV